MGAIADDRGQEEVSVLTELEVQRWVGEALENAARTTKCILEKFASSQAEQAGVTLSWRLPPSP